MMTELVLAHIAASLALYIWLATGLVLAFIVIAKLASTLVKALSNNSKL